MNRRMLAVPLIGCVMLAACPSHDSGSGHQAYGDPRLVAQGRQLFAAYCAPCHGALGHGGQVGPDLSASRFKYGKTRAELVQTIMKGRRGGMPAFAAQLQSGQADALAAYLRQLQ